MEIDRILYPINTLGPGKRLVIWTIGCSKHCYKCSNPELWNKNPHKNIDVYEFVMLIRQAVNRSVIDGVTITGGDPLEQIHELIKLLPLLREMTNDVLIYTGYTLEKAKKTISKSDWEMMIFYTSVLIDGNYIDGMNNNKCVLRGSSNQNVIYFDKNKKELYSAYINKGRTVQNVFYNDKIISVGIHNRDL